MTPERWSEIQQHLHVALSLRSEARNAFFEGLRERDLDLCDEVESLLAAESADPEFLNSPVQNAIRDGEPAPQAAQDSMIGRVFGAYRLIELIGAGGMGEVYRAIRVDGQYQQQVAVKIVRPGLAVGFNALRFRNERQILANLDHPNIAKILDGGTTGDGTPYLTMELIEGVSIDRYCDRHNLTTGDRLALFMQVCSAVHYAHQHLVVHRDIKPTNILVTSGGATKLLDFGIAKILGRDVPSADATVTGVRAMTPQYASPEQLRGEPITTATDVYSLGLVLYELLTGRPAFGSRGNMPLEIARGVLEMEPEKPSAALRKRTRQKLTSQTAGESGAHNAIGAPADKPLSADLDSMVLKALRNDPRDRYGSVEQLSDDIRRHLEGLPVRARKGTLSYRVSKYVFRHKIAVASAAVVFVVLIAGMIVTLREARIAKANALRAERRLHDVQQLANSLIFDVHDSIQDLPGSTATRRVIVDQARRYLDSLTQEGSGDLQLQRELAATYQRLGNLLGGPRLASLGDSAGAMQSYMKSLELRQAIAASGGATGADQIQLAEMHRVVAEMSHFSGDLGQAFDHAEKAAAIANAAMQGTGGGHADAAEQLARAYKALAEIEWSGMAFGSFADSDAALDYSRKSLMVATEEAAAEPENARFTRLVMWIRILIARTQSQNGHRSEAISELRSVLATYRSVSSQGNSFTYQRGLGESLEELGNALERDNRLADALACHQEELAIFQRLSSADPGNAQARFDLVGATFEVGASLMRQGKPVQGLPLIQQAISMEQGIMRLDPNRIEYRTWMAVFRVAEGEALSRLGRRQEALASFVAAKDYYEGVAQSDPRDEDERLSGLATDEKIAATLLRLGKYDHAKEIFQRVIDASSPDAAQVPPKQQAQYTLAEAYSGLADAWLHLAMANGDPASVSGYRAQAISKYRESLRVWNTVPNPSRISPNGFDMAGPGKVERQLATWTGVPAKNPSVLN
ncbi:MAG TPA: serine/threonine-protein kinase [Terriglobales bacterium]